uniref:Uncharacterized protein n=1 Tax=uncultured bacterium 126 TaxID=698379 RepID=E3T710_9BACT|nr:hypothetical protein [uncultured bacterium 126]
MLRDRSTSVSAPRVIVRRTSWGTAAKLATFSTICAPSPDDDRSTSKAVTATLPAGTNTECTIRSGASARRSAPSVKKCVAPASLSRGHDPSGLPLAVRRVSARSRRAWSPVGDSTIPSPVVATAISCAVEAEAIARACATARSHRVPPDGRRARIDQEESSTSSIRSDDRPAVRAAGRATAAAITAAMRTASTADTIHRTRSHSVRS